jgi:23S rRNA maturation mini-RNase III
MIHFDDGEFIRESYKTFETLEEAVELAKSECLDRFTSVSVYSGEYVEWGEQAWIKMKKEEERLKKEEEELKMKRKNKAKQKRRKRTELEIYQALKKKYEGVE